MIKARKAELSDSKTIFKFLNDQLTRAMSHNTAIVDWEGHSNWFASSLENKNRLLLLCEDKNDLKKIAVVRFDVDSSRAIVSINLAPDMRGKGISKQCLREAITSFKNDFSQVNALDAEIKLRNIASQKLFESVGFVNVRDDVNTLFYEYSI